MFMNYKGIIMEENSNNKGIKTEEYAVKLAAAILRSSEKTVLTYIKKGILGARKWNGQWVIDGDSLKEVYIFHPIVVIDSMLWKAESSELEQLKWCRLRFAISGGSDWWSDVVQEDHFASYAAEVTEHYTHCLASNQAQRMGV